MTRTQIPVQHLDALRRFKAEVFQALSHPTRIHILETLRERELSVGAILEHVKVEPANLSQHLSILRGRELVVSRKDGNQVLYSLSDPFLTEILDILRKYFQRHFATAAAMLKTIEHTR